MEREWETGVVDQAGVKVLYRSTNFTVCGEFEMVLLAGRSLILSPREPRRMNPAIEIGDFYGDPEAACIDADESWCVVVGLGFIAYRLGPPWTEYRYQAPKNDQYWEFGRRSVEFGEVGDDQLWFDSATSVGSGRFVVVSESGDEFEVDAEKRIVSALS
jgi:hypothetical protein